jgi:CDP-glucose 4,6-dehydratase
MPHRGPSPSSAFRDRRVFVTGHTGFKGAWLSLWLAHAGARVTGFARPPTTEPNLFDALHLERQLRHVAGDVCDLPALRAALHESRAEVVFHLAAQSLVRPSYQDPKATFDTNVGGTVNVLEAVRTSGRVRALILVTSDKCYESPPSTGGFREGDRLGGADPYSASKACAELVAAAYGRSFFPPERAGEHGLGLATVRAGNVLGGGDWSADRIVPDCVRAQRAGRPIGLRCPAAVRPWQHVLEPLGGYLLLAARLLHDPARYSGAWNFGPPAASCRPVREVAEAVIRAWGGGRWEDHSLPTHESPHEASALRLCSDKALTRLNWAPVWDFEEAVDRTVAWYRAFDRNAGSADRLCLADIQAFCAQGGAAAA